MKVDNYRKFKLAWDVVDFVASIVPLFKPKILISLKFFYLLLYDLGKKLGHNLHTKFHIAVCVTRYVTTDSVLLKIRFILPPYRIYLGHHPPVSAC